MIKVQTFLSIPQIERPGPVGQELITKYFYDIENQNNEEEIKRIFDAGGNIYGCVLITQNDKVILNDELIERFPLYWFFWAEIIRDYLRMSVDTDTVSIEPYFSLTKNENNTIIFTYSDFFTFTLPEKEFLLSVLQGGKTFFEKYQELCNKPVELDTAEKINNLFPLVDKL